MEIKRLKIVDICPNEGQIPDVPQNPRIIKDDKFNKLVLSLKEDPEWMQARPIVVFPYNNSYVAIAGNMRLRACENLKIKEIDCIVLSKDTSIDKLKRYIIKDNVSFGFNDFDLLSSEWEEKQLEDWGMDLPLFVEEEINDEQIKLSSKNTKIVIELSNDDNQEPIKKAIEESIKGFPEATIK